MLEKVLSASKSVLGGCRHIVFNLHNAKHSHMTRVLFGTEFCISADANEKEAVLPGNADDAMLDQSPFGTTDF